MERTLYMQTIMGETYSDVAIEAIKSGFEGSWERLIARRLRRDYIAGHSEAETIVQSVSGNFIEAAHLIIASKVPDNGVK